MTLDSILFYLLGAVAIGSALMMITRRNPVLSALYLILNFFALAGLYLTLHAQFIAIIQILVYAGAIMVLFLFVIMLLNLGDEASLRSKLTRVNMFAIALSGALILELLYIFGYSMNTPAASLSPNALEIGTIEYIGKQLFTTFLFPFEVTSILLLAAIVGAVIMAKKKLD
ncbi:MAG: NADH-quinone oxidoreductase subunit J [bacterium]